MPKNNESKNERWVKRNLGLLVSKYSGEWIAVSRNKVYAHGLPTSPQYGRVKGNLRKGSILYYVGETKAHSFSITSLEKEYEEWSNQE